MNPIPLLLAEIIPVARDVRVAKQGTNLFQGTTLGFGEEEVQCDDVEGARNDEHEIESPANAVHGNGGGNQSHLRGQVERSETQRNASGPKMVGEDFGNVAGNGGQRILYHPCSGHTYTYWVASMKKHHQKM